MSFVQSQPSGSLLAAIKTQASRPAVTPAPSIGLYVVSGLAAAGLVAMFVKYWK